MAGGGVVASFGMGCLGKLVGLAILTIGVIVLVVSLNHNSTSTPSPSPSSAGGLFGGTYQHPPAATTTTSPIAMESDLSVATRKLRDMQALANAAMLSDDGYRLIRDHAELLGKQVLEARKTSSPDLPDLSAQSLKAKSALKAATDKWLKSPDLLAAGDRVLALKRAELERNKIAVSDSEKNRYAAMRTEILKSIGESNRHMQRLGDVTMDGSTLRVPFSINQNLTTSLAVRSAYSDMAEIIRIAAEAIPWSDIEVAGCVPLSDAYGNSREEYVLRVTLSRDTVSKINWSGFRPENLPLLAKSFFQHPALSD